MTRKGDCNNGEDASNGGLPLRPTPFLLIEVTASWTVEQSDIRPLELE